MSAHVIVYRVNHNCASNVCNFPKLTVGSGTGSSDDNSSGSWSLWATTMLLIGVLICIIIIVSAVGFICYHVHMQRRLRKSLQANQALLVNGEAPNSPTRSQDSRTAKTMGS